MFKDEFKERYTTIPFAIHRTYTEKEESEVISHQHRELEIISVEEGYADFFVDLHYYRVEEGEVLIIPPYAIHRAITAPDRVTAYSCICFDQRLLCDKELVSGLEGRTVLTRHKVDRDMPFAPALQSCVEEGCLACEGAEAGWELRAIGNMSLLFGMLKSQGFFHSSLTDNSEIAFAQRVLDYIADNYSTAVTSATAAAYLYMNNSYFCRVFRKTFGSCFSEYILAFRLEKAKILLRAGSLSVNEIAFRTGFNSCSYFGKVFKDSFGMTPLAYRRSRDAG